MEQFSAYGHALLAVAIYAVITMVLNAVTGIRKGNANMAPGEGYKADYDDPSYRIDRAYMNSMELMGIYAAVTFSAVLAGASPFWTNVLASAILVFRVLYTFAYFRKIGAGYGGVRTILLVLSAAAIICLCVLTAVSVF